jgi:ATP-binding cassette, subfamily D (ALD), member 3
MGILDSILVKYGAFVIGYVLVGLPVFGPRRLEYLKFVGNDKSIIVKDYVRNTGLLINLARAIGRIIISYKEL